MTSQDFKKRLDITGLTQVTGSQMNQLVDTALPADDKGIIIVTTDTALDTPDVPNPDVELEGVTPDHWKRYIWIRKPFDDTGYNKFYSWNDNLVADATLLKWEYNNQAAEDAELMAQTAQTTAQTAQTEAEAATVRAINADNKAVDAQATADEAVTIAQAAEAKNTQQDTSIAQLGNGLLIVQDLLVGVEFPLPVSKGGTGATSPDGAVENLGMAKSPIAFTIIKDVKSTGTDGGTFTAGAWQQRTLNTREAIGIGAVTLNNDNTFSLPRGSYIIEAESVAFLVNAHKIRLVKIDTADEVVAIGSNARANSTDDNEQSSSKLSAIITVSATFKFKIEHYCETTRADDGFGFRSAFPDTDEVYTIVKITTLATE